MLSATQRPTPSKIASCASIRELLDRVGSVCKRLGVVSLGADCSRKRTSKVSAHVQQVDDVSKVVAGFPAEFSSRALADVNAIDVWKHRPPPPPVHVFVARYVPPDHRGSVCGELRQVVACKRGWRAHDETAEPHRLRAVQREYMRADNVGDVGAAI